MSVPCYWDAPCVISLLMSACCHDFLLVIVFSHDPLRQAGDTQGMTERLLLLLRSPPDEVYVCASR